LHDASIRLLVLDVDGVLTDGNIGFDDNGVQSRRFHIRDGLAITLWKAVGRQVGILSSKDSAAVRARAAMLGIELIEQGAQDKLPGLERLMHAANVTGQQTAYVGDDLLDLAAMRRVAYPIAVADAADEVRAAARFVTTRRGGDAAVREAIEHLLKAQGAWEQALRAIGADR
jgi:3-deoxy-D-manno-octulosonate 8-phosphate phosphatase (KDO 8-P phosphatase)